MHSSTHAQHIPLVATIAYLSLLNSLRALIHCLYSHNVLLFAYCYCDHKVLHLAQRLPKLAIQAAVQPVTSRILRVSLTVSGDFEWQDKWHGQSEPWWIWVEDSNSEHIYHSEHFVLGRKGRFEEHLLTFNIPVFEPLPPQYWTQLFHVLYHTDASVLLGAPTGSGKTAVAEIAVLRMVTESR
eukprot:12794-Heterococcus_DN1.PRE.2